MQLQRGDLRQRSQSLDAIDLEVGVAVPRNPHKADQAGEAAHGVALEESLAVDAIRATDEGAGPALDVRQHPLANGGEVIGELALGDGAAIARIRPQHLSGLEIVTPVNRRRADEATAPPPDGCALWLRSRLPR